MQHRMLRRLFFVSCIAIATLSVCLFVFMKLSPVAFRAIVFQPVREISFFVRELEALGNWDSIEKVVVAEPETVRIAAQGPLGVDISAGVYRPAASSVPAPAVVILHGSYPWGRKAGLIRFLAASLAADGFFVVAPDARGFGETADPAQINDPESWRTARDLGAMIDYLLDTGSVDPNDIFVIGHSMGANHALEGGLSNPRVKALVLIGPGRFTQQEDINLPDWELARFSADRQLERPLSREVALFAYSLGNLRLLAETELANSNHKPILLIDGEYEGDAKLRYTADIVSKLDGPIEYRTLANTGHYCGVRSFYGSETVYIQPQMFTPFYDIMLEFLSRQAGGEEGSATDRITSE